MFMDMLNIAQSTIICVYMHLSAYVFLLYVHGSLFVCWCVSVECVLRSWNVQVASVCVRGESSVPGSRWETAFTSLCVPAVPGFSVHVCASVCMLQWVEMWWMQYV